MSGTSAGVSRRTLLLGGAAGAVLVAAGAAYAVAPTRVEKLIGLGPDPYVPDVPEGQVTLETVHSEARGHDVDLFTAVPYGHGDGAGLPVVVVLHGASATASRFRGLGLAKFVTATVQQGAEPFVLAGADGGSLGWHSDDSGDDPQAMVIDELPAWLSDRGFDSERRAVWGWSLGGYGGLRLAETDPTYARAVAVFSPAVQPEDWVFEHVGALVEEPMASGAGQRTRSTATCAAWSRRCRPTRSSRRTPPAATRTSTGTSTRSAH